MRTVVRALPSLTACECRALAGMLDGRSYAEIGPTIAGSTAASHAVDRARRKLAAALRQAA